MLILRYELWLKKKVGENDVLMSTFVYTVKAVFGVVDTQSFLAVQF